MRKLVSVLVTLAFVSMVPLLAAAELSVPDSCCSMSGGESMMAMPCCQMETCSMSSQLEPVRTPTHEATMSESGRKLPTPKPVVAPVADSILTSKLEFASTVELLDPSPPPRTSERLAAISWYLI